MVGGPGERPRASPPCASACSSPTCSAPTATAATPSCWPSASPGAASPSRSSPSPPASAAPDSCDLYLVGGGEDGPQVQATRELGREPGPAPRRRPAARSCSRCAPACRSSATASPTPPAPTGRGSACSTATPSGSTGPGPSASCSPPRLGPRSRPDLPAPRSTWACSPASRTTPGAPCPGPAARTLASVEVGEGNGDGTEGVVCGRVVGTYLHGPVLARNPAPRRPAARLGRRRRGADPARRPRGRRPAHRAPPGGPLARAGAATVVARPAPPLMTRPPRSAGARRHRTAVMAPRHGPFGFVVGFNQLGDPVAGRRHPPGRARSRSGSPGCSALVAALLGAPPDGARSEPATRRRPLALAPPTLDQGFAAFALGLVAIAAVGWRWGVDRPGRARGGPGRRACCSQAERRRRRSLVRRRPGPTGHLPALPAHRRGRAAHRVRVGGTGRREHPTRSPERAARAEHHRPTVPASPGSHRRHRHPRRNHHGHHSRRHHELVRLACSKGPGR